APRTCCRSPKPGGHIARWRRACCGPIIAPSKVAKARRPHRKNPPRQTQQKSLPRPNPSPPIRHPGRHRRRRPKQCLKKSIARKNMPAELDGPRLAPKSGPAQQLIVFLHGYGADGNDLIDIGRTWQEMLPNAAFVSPHAPEPCGQAPMGRQWFPLAARTAQESWSGVNKAAPVLQHFFDAELERHKLPPTALRSEERR